MRHVGLAEISRFEEPVLYTSRLSLTECQCPHIPFLRARQLAKSFSYECLAAQTLALYGQLVESKKCLDEGETRGAVLFLESQSGATAKRQGYIPYSAYQPYRGVHYKTDKPCIKVNRANSKGRYEVVHYRSE